MDRGRAEEARFLKREIVLAGRTVEYRVERRRRRTIGLVVDSDGLRVAAPLRAPWHAIEAFVREKERWILARLERRVPRIVFQSGESLPLFGSAVTLRIREGRHAVFLERSYLTIEHPRPAFPELIRRHLIGWFKRSAYGVLAPRVTHYAAHLGLAPPSVAISNARTQWGVCNARGRIRLAWRLVHLAPALSDYVVAHEVAHLVELNHSSRFWNVVQSLYPDWRTARIAIRRAAAAIPLI